MEPSDKNSRRLFKNSSLKKNRKDVYEGFEKLDMTCMGFTAAPNVNKEDRFYKK